MWSALLFVSVVGGSFLQAESSFQVFKCDKDVIKNIKESCWKGNTPNDILEKFLAIGQFDLVASTPKYIDEQYDGCYAYFTKEDGNVFTKETIFLTPKDGGEETKVENELIEAGGVVIRKNSKLKRYPVYSENGVIACYSCTDSDKAVEGPAAAYIVAGSGYSTDDVDKAKSKLESVCGVKKFVDFTYEESILH